MVLERPANMSSVRKLSFQRIIKAPFGRKSSEKSPNKLTATTDLEIDAVVKDLSKADVVNSARHISIDNGVSVSLPVVKSPYRKSHKWFFRSKSLGSTCTENNDNDGHTTTSETCDVKINSTTNEVCQHDIHVPGSTMGKQHSEGTRGPSGHPKGDQYVFAINQSMIMNNQAKLEKNILPETCQNVSHNECGAELSCSDNATTRSCTGTPSPSQPCLNTKQNLECPSVPRKSSTTDVLLVEPSSSNILPPQIPPKPALLRNWLAPDECSITCASEEIEDPDLPPRPPARPKNHTWRKRAVPPAWVMLNQPLEIVDNRATVYELIDEVVPKEGCLAEELAKLPRQPWYWGPLTQRQAEEKLSKLPDGNFLVRDSSDERYLLSLSFNSHGRTLHTRIEHRNGYFSLNDSDGHTSVVDLIECAVKESRSGVYGYMRDNYGMQSFPARLTDWVSRYTEMRSLQHLCRFLIREVYPRHHIQKLPLPKKIKEYILENQY